jgi:hypothetical protein
MISDLLLTMMASGLLLTGLTLVMAFTADLPQITPRQGQ